MTWRATCLLMFVMGCFGECSAQCVRLDVDGDQPGKATAFCIGETSDGNVASSTLKATKKSSNYIIGNKVSKSLLIRIGLNQREKF